MNFRERVADSLALPVKALLDVEVTYDLSRAARYDLDSRTLRRQALRSRADILLAVAEYTAAEATLRRESSKRHPEARLIPGCAWDAEQNRWAINLKPNQLTNFHPSLNAPQTQRRTQRDSEMEHPADSVRLRAAAVAWEVRATLRTNLLAYVAVQRRQELLRELESTQVGVGPNRGEAAG